jgi:hypothetical protein
MDVIPVKIEVILFILIYFSLVLILTKFAGNRNLNKLNTFILSTIFTPVVGFFYILFSASPVNAYRHKVKIYHCKNCNFEFKRSFDKCPVCGAEYRKEIK